MLALLNIAFSSIVVFSILFYSTMLFRKVRDRIIEANNAQEILIVFNMIKEDIMRSFYLEAENNRIVIKGFLLSFSDEENDKNWGIIIDCQNSRATVYNIIPQNFVFVWNENNISVYPVYSKRRLDSKRHEIRLPSCPPSNSFTFSNFYEVYWSSSENKIYRESIRNDGSQTYKSKFFVAKGEILISNRKVQIKNKNYEIGFNID
ncbi:MAG: hypothetical protein NZ927_01815 [Candidatus Calescibacterium sp.]|nr:hypothetical protein [Candidatus Calescibacterium sp.]MCX7734433.1 hypothetical protein [bacterium]MDW8086801.1 hypothetical protein [Candidatus Calescibacterium sp.]